MSLVIFARILGFILQLFSYRWWLLKYSELEKGTVSHVRSLTPEFYPLPS